MVGPKGCQDQEIIGYSPLAPLLYGDCLQATQSIQELRIFHNLDCKKPSLY